MFKDDNERLQAGVLAIDAIMKALEQGKRVLFYEAEGSARDLQQRLRRAVAAHKVEHPHHLRVFHNADVDLTRDQGVEAVLARAREHRPDLIVFDSLNATRAAPSGSSSARSASS
jgi:predicted ATP-dependent serine protease